MEDSNHKGNVAELAIAAEGAKLGLSVLKPLTEHERYDLVLGIGGRLFRVQCKWASKRGDVVHVRLRTSYHSPTRGYVAKTYAADEIDLVAAYCQELDRSYLLPVELFAGRSMVYLRLERARNNQRASLNWATAYEFPGAVAQLAERSNGIRKVRGSIPLSSTPSRDGVIPAQAVGAHEFRNRFGYYLERAAAGDEIAVTRHGRPYARLVPAVLNPVASGADE
jgi:prevent-host-death family protein